MMLHEGLQKPSVINPIFQPGPTTAQSRTEANCSTGVLTYTQTLHCGAAEALKTTLSSLCSVTHTAHNSTQKGYTLWWHPVAPTRGVQPPDKRPGLCPKLGAIVHALTTMAL